MNPVSIYLLNVALILTALTGCVHPEQKALIFHAGAGQRSSLDECAEIFFRLDIAECL